MRGRGRGLLVLLCPLLALLLSAIRSQICDVNIWACMLNKTDRQIEWQIIRQTYGQTDRRNTLLIASSFDGAG